MCKTYPVIRLLLAFYSSKIELRHHGLLLAFYGCNICMYEICHFIHLGHFVTSQCLAPEISRLIWVKNVHSWTLTYQYFSPRKCAVWFENRAYCRHQTHPCCSSVLFFKKTSQQSMYFCFVRIFGGPFNGTSYRKMIIFWVCWLLVQFLIVQKIRKFGWLHTFFKHKLAKFANLDQKCINTSQGDKSVLYTCLNISMLAMYCHVLIKFVCLLF